MVVKELITFKEYNRLQKSIPVCVANKHIATAVYHLIKTSRSVWIGRKDVIRIIESVCAPFKEFYIIYEMPSVISLDVNSKSNNFNLTGDTDMNLTRYVPCDEIVSLCEMLGRNHEKRINFENIKPEDSVNIMSKIIISCDFNNKFISVLCSDTEDYRIYEASVNHCFMIIPAPCIKAYEAKIATGVGSLLHVDNVELPEGTLYHKILLDAEDFAYSYDADTEEKNVYDISIRKMTQKFWYRSDNFAKKAIDVAQTDDTELVLDIVSDEIRKLASENGEESARIAKMLKLVVDNIESVVD